MNLNAAGSASSNGHGAGPFQALQSLVLSNQQQAQVQVSAGSQQTPTSSNVYAEHLTTMNFMEQGPVCTTALDAPGSLDMLTDSSGPLSLEDVSKGLAGPRPLQPRLLKQINALNTKEELLDYVARCHQLLDPINLVTCLYRLARIYSITQVSVQKTVWRSDLFASPAFGLLLGSIHSHLVQAQAILSKLGGEVPGLNARCMSNLIWAMVKLEVTAEDGHAMAAEIVTAAAPLVVCFLSDCSGQGLANLLWSFAKIHTTPPFTVLTAIVKRMVDLLQEPAASSMLDIQALSNSIWAIAHVQSSTAAMEGQDEWQEAVANFLLLMANQCLTLLHTVIERPSMLRRTLLSGMEMDGKVSCQAIANIAWSFATILGSACGVQDPVRPLFLLIRQLTIAKLGNSAVLQAKPAWAQSLAGTFNEQALANVVFAFEKAQLLNGPLLQVVLDAASQKLVRASAASSSSAGQSQQSHGPLGFKPQELCILLSACHMGIAQPWAFLQTLSRVLKQHPLATNGWSAGEQAEVRRALNLLSTHLPEAQVQAVLNRPQGVWPMQLAATSASHLQALSANSMPNLAAHSAPHSLIYQEAAADVPLSTPSLQVPVQQVWLRSADGVLQPATLLLSPQLQGHQFGGAGLQPHSDGRGPTLLAHIQALDHAQGGGSTQSQGPSHLF